MRKDVKFGLTIGAVLVVTLVIYVIVLSRGPSVPQKMGITLPSKTDQTASDGRAPDATADSSDSTSTPHVDDKTAAPDDTEANSTVNSTPAPETSAPATQPAVSAQPNNDWEGALNRGLPVATAAPEHTVTPTIEPYSSNLSNPSGGAHSGISRSQTTPLIDSLPSTQPSRPMMADIPMLDAPATVSPAPATVSPRIDSAPSYSSNSANMAQPNTPRTHRIMSGESPYSISQMVYGSGKYYKKILAANPKVDPRHLRIGQVLIIPELTDSDKPASPAAANSAASEPIDTKTAYKVIAGDTLERISQKVYHTSQMIDKIYDANKSLIGPDENVLKIGWVLKLPEPPAAENAQR